MNPLSKSQALKGTQSLYKRRFICVHRYTNETLPLALRLFEENPESLIKYMRETFGSNYEKNEPITINQVVAGERVDCRYEGHPYLIVKVDGTAIVIYEEVGVRTVSPPISDIQI